MATEEPEKPIVAPQSAQQMFAMDSGDFFYEDDQGDETIPQIQKITKSNNILPTWGNQGSMNLNALVLENITDSPYYKNKLSDFKMWSQVMDEIYFNVTHLEPWERGTRKTTGQTGMCGGVRGVGAGGVVSTAYCCLFKLFNIKITRKQLVGMINHADSPYIRGLGFMYIRYCQPPADLWDWLEAYLDDDDEVDPKAGGGDRMTIGQMVKLLLTKLDWYGTLFPRIPVPIQKVLETKFRERNQRRYADEIYEEAREKAEKVEKELEQEKSRDSETSRDRERQRSRDKDSRRDRRRSRSRDRSRDRDSRRRSKDRSSRDRDRKDSRDTRDRDSKRSGRDRSSRRSRSRSRSSRRRSRSRDRKGKDSPSHKSGESKRSRSPGRTEKGKEKESRNQEAKKPEEKKKKLSLREKRKKCGHYERKRLREEKKRKEEQANKPVDPAEAV